MAIRDRNVSFLRSGKLARLAGISTDTLRFYERKGLLAPPCRSTNGYREYTAASLDRVRLIRSALAIGFTTDDLTRILKTRDRGSIPCRDVIELADVKLLAIEERLRETELLRDQLKTVICEWKKQIKSVPAGQRAGLLEALARQSGSAPPISPYAPRSVRSHRKNKEAPTK